MRGRELKPGETFEGYRIEKLLGAGGMGEVYRAFHLFTERETALKIISAERASSREARALIEKEAKVLCRLEHPNIVRVLTAGQLDDGTVYIAMELLEGETLRKRVRAKAPLSIPEALAIAIAAGKALAYGHGLDVVHRDIKPENIFLDEDRQVKVLDYGIARLGAMGMKSTRSDRRFGTPAYSAPEQLTGGVVGAWSDVYALGVCLYEMLTGRHPLANGPGHTGMPRGPALALAQERDPPRPIVKFMPEFGELSYVLEPLWIALRKAPAERHPTMAAFVAALEATRSRYLASHKRSRPWPTAARASRPDADGERGDDDTEVMPHVVAQRIAVLVAPAVPSSARDRLPSLVGSASERAGAARRLGAHDEPKARARLLEAIVADPDARVRVACAESLVENGDREALATLEIRLEREADELARTAIFDAVKHLKKRFPDESADDGATVAEGRPRAPAEAPKVVEASRPQLRPAGESVEVASRPPGSRFVRSVVVGALVGIPAGALLMMAATRLSRPAPAAEVATATSIAAPIAAAPPPPAPASAVAPAAVETPPSASIASVASNASSSKPRLFGKLVKPAPASSSATPAPPVEPPPKHDRAPIFERE